MIDSLEGNDMDTKIVDFGLNVWDKTYNNRKNFEVCKFKR